MVVAITDARTVPISEDLTTSENRLEILRGLENMHRVDYPIAAGQSFSLGEWAILNASGELERAGVAPVANSYLMFTDGGRFDVAATGQGTIIQNSGVVVRSTVYDKVPTYAVGDALVVKDLGGGESFLTKRTVATDPAVALVVSEDGTTLKYDVTRT